VLWEDGQVTELAVLPGSFGSQAFYVNDKGQVVGETFPRIGGHALLWETPTQVVDLGVGLGMRAVAYSINMHGQIAGELNGRAVVWEDGQMTDLGEGRAIPINDKGQVAGNLVDPVELGVLWPGSKKVKKPKEGA
jgi:uncharacterized membrane protein